MEIDNGSVVGLETWDGRNTVTKHRCECTLWGGDRCTKSARYIIDDIHLCTQHAGPIAIVKLLAKNEAFKIEVTNQYASDPLCQLTTMYDYRRDRGIKL